MNNLPIFVAAVVALLTSTSFATAQADHGHVANPPGETSSGGGDLAMMGGDHSQMMQMMMAMHTQMMGGKDMSMMGDDETSRMEMKDSDMMRMMMGSTTMEARSPEDATVALESWLAEFDKNGDGGLSLSEFQALHTAMIQEAMVDRFQHLDADGDGQITADEMSTPVRRMEMRGMMGGAGSMMDNVVDDNTPN